MGGLVTVALVLACLGAGRGILISADHSTRLGADGVAGLTGLALLTWLGGWVVLAGAYSAVVGWALLGLGGGALALQLIRSRDERADPGPASGGVPFAALAFGLLSLAVAATRVLSEFALPITNVNDDLPTYWVFPRLLLESGGFIEPFNARRLVNLGATPFLQSFFWKDFTIAAGGIADAVLGQLLIWAGARAIPSTVSRRPQPAWRGEALALAALLLSLTLPRGNAMPTLLPMGSAIVLILLSRRITDAKSTADGIRTAVAWGLVAAWLIGLRVSNIPFPAILWLSGALVALWRRDQPLRWRYVVAALATVVGLIPWSLTLWQSSGTPFFPIVEGNYHLHESFPMPVTVPGVVAFVGDCLWTNHIGIVAAIGGLAALRPAVRQISLQIIVTLLMLVVVTAVMSDMGQSLDSFSIHRYSAPFLAAGLIFFTGAILVGSADARHTPGEPRGRWRPLWLAIALVPWLMIRVALDLGQQDLYWVSNGGVIWNSAIVAVRSAARAWDSGLEVPGWPGRADYEAAQASLPADARVVSATDKPFFFRFDRQVIHTLDIPGLVSPPPGMPAFEGPEQIAAYLRRLGYTHLAFTPPLASTGLYAPDQWTYLETYSRSYRHWARYVLKFLQNEERLARSYAVAYRGPGLVVIDLQSPAAGLREP